MSDTATFLIRFLKYIPEILSLSLSEVANYRIPMFYTHSL